MVPSPLVQQHLDIRLDDTECRYDIGGAHPSHAPNGGRLIALGKIDHDNHPGLSNMDVPWAVLTRRQPDANLKPVDVQYGGHRTITYPLGYCHDAPLL
jgi:hypothetical protein